ncbi:MAG: bifunctional aldolase/short-chain dehydrogenase [Candidatus Krumholzibacteria bacterium]|nr:bifunctional aldolase/short-chain dehydrogenase [Candidatus Krumholzibacteria bacterium]
MKSLWDDSDAKKFGDDALGRRVYTSRLIGAESELVLHGGGNTSVKAEEENLFGDRESILYVKGSGWDLATIEREGFAPVRLEALRRMAKLPRLSDADMVRAQRAAMTDPSAPTPSVEAILHAIIPFAYVDHTHADAVVTISNTPRGTQLLAEIYGDRIFIVPYIMPGFALARDVYEMTRDIDWEQIEGMILLNHGVFTFGEDARSSYERMIQIVTEAEDYLEAEAPLEPAPAVTLEVDPAVLARLRHAVSEEADAALTLRHDTSAEAVIFSELDHVSALATRGPLTPDHVIRTKRTALVVGEDIHENVTTYAEGYREYFDRNTDGTLTCLDAAPRWALWPGRGVIAFGRGDAEAAIVADILAHTMPAIRRAEALGGWEPLGEEEIFDVEYWELEQAKLTRAGKPPAHQGKVVVVSGAASGIGLACVQALREAGACVVALDIDPHVRSAFDGAAVLGLQCDVTDAAAVDAAVVAGVCRYGGIDIVVSNAGTFPATETLADMRDETWEKSLAVNLSGHRHLLQKCVPFLREGIDPAVVFVGSKNVAAPGSGAGAYSVAKAGLAQLARVAALELAGDGIRVNTVHPNDVFDTAIWTEEVLKARAAHYGMSVEAYRTRNLLGIEVTSREVAAVIVALAGPLFSRTTGAHIPVDGGNDRVI